MPPPKKRQIVTRSPSVRPAEKDVERRVPAVADAEPGVDRPEDGIGSDEEPSRGADAVEAGLLRKGDPLPGQAHLEIDVVQDGVLFPAEGETVARGSVVEEVLPVEEEYEGECAPCSPAHLEA